LVIAALTDAGVESEPPHPDKIAVTTMKPIPTGNRSLRSKRAFDLAFVFIEQLHL
jgi:hypothetical protein